MSDKIRPIAGHSKFIQVRNPNRKLPEPKIESDQTDELRLDTDTMMLVAEIAQRVWIVRHRTTAADTRQILLDMLRELK